MEYILPLAFFLIALVYASVGFGGGTSYLALMSVVGVDFVLMRPTALLCNIVVVTTGTYIFSREGLLDLKRTWPYLAASVPLAFLGGYWPITESAFFFILGVTLVLASIPLWFQEKIFEIGSDTGNRAPGLSLILGGSVGFLSGLVSIGGGIFLSPILHFLRWDTARRISALASVFILVNSISGLFGQITRAASFDFGFVAPLLLAVFVGGQVGSRLGAKRFNPMYIRRITAVLILVAGINIIVIH